jgi:hypothetical protein
MVDSSWTDLVYDVASFNICWLVSKVTAMNVESSYLDSLHVALSLLLKVFQLQSLGPSALVQVQQHPLLRLGLSVVDGQTCTLVEACPRASQAGRTVVMPVETMYQSLDGRLVQVSQVARCLSALLAGHKGVWVDRSERVNNDLASHGLDRVDDDGHGSRVELLKGLNVRTRMGTEREANRPVGC